MTSFDQGKLGKVERLQAQLALTAKAKEKAKATATRAAIVRWAHWGVVNEREIHYEEIRPMPLNSRLPLTTDCSGFATLCYFLAGAPDPNVGGYKGAGNTSTLKSHGTRVAPRDCLPGDLIVYGAGYGHHVVIAIEKGSDPLCVSHGQETGPAIIRHSIEAKYQPPGVAFLRFPMV